MFKTTVRIDGMMCGMCEAHINDAIRAAFPVKKVSSSHKTGVAEIISEAEIPEEALRAAIEKTGYTVVSVSVEPFEKKPLFSFKGKNR